MSEEETKAAGQNGSEPPVPISKAVLYLVLSILWAFPSIGACWLIGSDVLKWFSAKSFVAALASVKFEQWIALALLGLHLFFVVLAFRFRSRDRRNI